MKSSNRTFMELKCTSKYAQRYFSCVLIAPLWNWNELYSTLSFVSRPVLIAPLWNWNGSAVNHFTHQLPVLIAPLWNWNEIEMNVSSTSIICSNRTFMELKSSVTILILAAHNVLIAPLWNWNFGISNTGSFWIGSNRTFMELKYKEITDFALWVRVLIAPLWNWNL